MDKIKHYIKKFFKRTDFSGLTVFGRGQHFDWEILLAFLLLVIIVTISFSIYVFLGVRAGDIFQVNSKVSKTSQTINREVLDLVITNFGVRADALKKIQSQRPFFVDPSL